MRNALHGHEDDCVLWNDLGVILWRAGKLRDAEAALRNAIILRPGYDEAKTNLSSLLASRGFYRQALRIEEELISGRPLHRDFHERRMEEYRKAIAELEKENRDEGQE